MIRRVNQKELQDMINKFCQVVFLLFFMTILFSGCGAHWRSMQNAHKGHNRLDDGKPDEAIEYFELAKKDKDLPGIYFGLHSAYLVKEEYLTSEEYLLAGLDLYPGDKFLNLAAGTFYLYIKKDYDEAIYYLEIAREKFGQRQILNKIDNHLDKAYSK